MLNNKKIIEILESKAIPQFSKPVETDKYECNYENRYHPLSVEHSPKITSPSCLKNSGIKFVYFYKPDKHPLKKEELKRIFDKPYSHDIERNFDKLIEDKVLLYEVELRKQLFDIISENWEEDGFFPADEINKFLFENVFVMLNKKDYLDQVYQTNIMLDTGDGSYDFTINSIFGSWCSYPEIHEESAIVWLMKQQGFKMKTIKEFVFDKNFKTDDKFLKSIKDECSNLYSDMFALTFLCNLTLREIIEFNKKISWTSENRETEKVIISKETKGGLYDPWRGCTGMLDIELNKNVTIPLKYIFSVKPDGCEGFGIEEHLDDKYPYFWEPGKIVKFKN